MTADPPAFGRQSAGAASGDLSRAGLAGLRRAIERTITTFLAGQRLRMTALAPASAHLVDLVGEAVSAGGRRLRPALCYAAYRVSGGADGAEILRAAASLELLHASAILHDDIMDQADLRRGQPSLHRRLAGQRRAASGDEDADADVFGVSVAILAGDLAWVLSDAMLASSGFDAPTLSRAGPALDTMRAQAIAGQYLDLTRAGSRSTPGPGAEDAGPAGDAAVAFEDAAVIGRLKAAGYSVEGPVAVGAALAGAPAATRAALAGFGHALGEAFFLRDEVLGVFGDPADTGKDAESDLRRGKPITLIAGALARAGAAERAVILQHWGDPDATAEDLTAVRAAIRSSGALAAAGTAIDSEVEHALEALRAGHLMERPGAAVLTGLAGALRTTQEPLPAVFG